MKCGRNGTHRAAKKLWWESHHQKFSTGTHPPPALHISLRSWHDVMLTARASRSLRESEEGLPATEGHKTCGGHGHYHSKLEEADWRAHLLRQQQCNIQATVSRIIIDSTWRWFSTLNGRQVNSIQNRCRWPTHSPVVCIWLDGALKNFTMSVNGILGSLFLLSVFSMTTHRNIVREHEKIGIKVFELFSSAVVSAPAPTAVLLMIDRFLRAEFPS